ncbi:MAG: CcmD family protein [Candidatus Limnocylindria bacterium]
MIENAGFLAAAYAVVWGGLLAYLVSLRVRSHR